MSLTVLHVSTASLLLHSTVFSVAETHLIIIHQGGTPPPPQQGEAEVWLGSLIGLIETTDGF